MRADLYAAAALGISRNKAAELLRAGELLIDGAAIKCSAEVAEGARCELLGELFVSRAALKLKYFLNEPLREAIAGARCVDVGASTGGFTQILLECGAASVAAVDVGSGQLHESLRRDARVSVHENTDVRDFAAQFDGGDGCESSGDGGSAQAPGGQRAVRAQNSAATGEAEIGDKPAAADNSQQSAGISEIGCAAADNPQQSAGISKVGCTAAAPFDILTADLSFISLAKVLAPLDALVRPGGALILLFKPQFEVGRAAARSKAGVVKDERATAAARAAFERECARRGWQLVRAERCQIAGKEGNFEYLYHLRKGR